MFLELTNIFDITFYYKWALIDSLSISKDNERPDGYFKVFIKYSDSREFIKVVNKDEFLEVRRQIRSKGDI